MKRHISFYLLILFILSLTGCGPNWKKVKDPFTPYERPNFSILSPVGDNWSMMTKEYNKTFSIVYEKQSESHNHSLTAFVEESHDIFKFSSPEDFLIYEKKLLNASVPEAYTNEIELDKKYGPYCVRFHTVYYTYPVGRVTTLGYTFYHPNFSDLKIVVVYNERGFSAELSPDFSSSAIQFFEGLNVK